ncbi:Ig-like domain repeat protein [Streptomyces yaanensis]|uniref:Ig-like domain repeat protein n=1 Tax=Streptomyces yaanensis TaxID=1142239 RepID=A0ABV7S9M8_9ACTN|nr:Ig-like domain repeat protein [Streptomyces sp. CGMCC 4.7035]WNB96649.1 Ig-like domain repeat protein [Streptomyces sp. CGMCC 4.7035]
MRTTSAATAFAVLFSSAALSVVAAGTASAQPATLTQPVGLVADGAVQRVFVADRANGRVMATDYSGTLVDMNVGFGDVSDLALSADGATLYAALPGSHEIVAFDAATLEVRTRYALGAGVTPRAVAFAGGRLWFSYRITGEDGAFHGNLGSVDPTATDVAAAVALGQLPGEVAPYYNAALLDADPTMPGLLSFTDSGDSPGATNVLDVSGATPQVVAKSEGGAYFGADVDLVPGTSEVLVGGSRRLSYANGTFTPAGELADTGWKADVSPGGLIAQSSLQRVSVYKPGATEPVRRFDTGDDNVGQVAWAPDSSRLFAVVGTDNGYTLKAFTGPALNVPTLTVNAPASATRAKTLTVTGKLSATVPFATGAKLAVTRTDLDSPSGKALAAVTVKADGTYSFTDTPPAGGKVTYKVTYAGDAEHTSATASAKVEVSRAATSLTLNNNGKLYNYGADVTFTAHLGTTYKNRKVAIYADPFGADKPKKLVKSGTVNSSGNLSVTLDMTRDTAVSAVFAGDSRYKPKTVKVTAYARVKVSTAVSRHYKTAKIGSTSYYWFHKNTDPLLTTTMTYYPGRQQRFDLQVYYGGSWYSAGSEYFPVGSNGKSAVSLEAPGESGIRARMRSVYVNGSSGDSVNSTTYGAWKYLYFSN